MGIFCSASGNIDIVDSDNGKFGSGNGCMC